MNTLSDDLFLSFISNDDVLGLDKWCLSNNVNEPTSSDQHFPLEIAIAVDASESFVATLISHGANPNQEFPSGSRCLNLAILMNNIATTRLLLKAKADVNALDEDKVSFLGQTVSISSCGQTPLHLACEKRYFDLVHLLLEHGACVDARNANGRSALSLTNDAMLINSGAKADDFANLLVQLQSHSKPELADSMSANKEDALERHRSDERLLRQRSKQARVAEIARKVSSGLNCIRQKYVPLHKDVYVDGTVEFVEHFDAAQQFQRVLPEYGLLTLSVLNEASCKKVFEEIVHYEREAKRLKLPLFYRHDDNIGSLERYGFLPLLQTLIEKSVNPLMHELCPDYPNTIAVARHAFLTRNWPGRTEEFAKFKVHRDKSAITLNLCVQFEDVQGSTVNFYRGQPDDEPPSDSDIVHILHHSIGVAALHTGQHWHKTNQLTKGLRASLIIWADIVEK